MMNVVICDDREEDRLDLQTKIENYIEKQTDPEAREIRVSILCSAEEMLARWKQMSPVELLFLDMMFPNGEDGIEAAKRLRAMDDRVVIVILSSTTAYATKGYEVRAHRYWEKPITQERVDGAIRYTRQTLVPSQKVMLKIREKDICIRDNILYLEAQYPKVRIKRRDGNDVFVGDRFTAVCDALPGEEFVMIHRSYCVNLRYVRDLNHAEAILEGGVKLPVARSRFKGFYEAFVQYHKGE